MCGGGDSDAGGGDAPGAGYGGPAGEFGSGDYSSKTGHGDYGADADMGRDDRYSEMTQNVNMIAAGMDPTSTVQRGIADIGSSFGFGPNPANVSHSAVFGGMTTPFGLATGVPTRAVFQAMEDPSIKSVGRVAAGTIAGPAGMKGYDMAFGAPKTSPGQGTFTGFSEQDTRDMNDDKGMREYEPLLPVAVASAQPEAPGLLETPALSPYKYNRSWWTGNKFNVAPIERV